MSTIQVSLLPPPCEELTTSEPFTQRNARQAAGRDVGLWPAEDEWTQIDMTRLDAVADESRHGGQRYHRLRDEIARRGLQLRGELIALALARRRPHEHSVAAGAVDGLDHQRIQMMQEHARAVRARAAPRRNVREYRILVEIVANHVRHVGVHELVVRDAGTGSISQRHVAFRPGAHQSGHAERRVSVGRESGSRKSSSIRR